MRRFKNDFSCHFDQREGSAEGKPKGKSDILYNQRL